MALNPWIVACVILASTATNADSNETGEFCPALQSQKNFAVDQLMRMWYVVEILTHQRLQGQQADGGVITRMESCPVVHLQRIGEARIKLLWDEMAGVVEHYFRQPIQYTPGFWITDGSPNSTLVDHNGKHIPVEFSGEVHVMKAVASHVVLTFCSSVKETLWTTVLSVNSSLDAVELRGVNKMLERRGLPLNNVVQTCSSAASAAATTLASLTLVVAAALGLR